MGPFNEPSGDATCPECGIEYSASESVYAFDGLGPNYIRSCKHGGRIYQHSTGDVRGYAESDTDE